MLYLADAVRDAAKIRAAPGAVAMRGGRVLAAGEVEKVRAAAESAAAEAGEVAVRRLPGRILLPGLVNAHAHLDLTSVGRLSYSGRFTDWVREVIRRRPTEAAAIAESVRLGVRQSLAAGVLTVGDIVGTEPPETALRNRTGLTGVSYIELFGIAGDPLERSLKTLRNVADAAGAAADSPMRLGLQPHAPYSAGPELYAAAQRLAAEAEVPVCTHLAETPEEARFTADADGPFRRLLVDIGRWDERHRRLYGHGRPPVPWLENALRNGERPTQTAPWLLAHCNYVDDQDIATLARRDWSVAYCPRASDYFGHRDHRYRKMLEAGVNVCLGTDSIICHGSLSILDEMRYLHQRDGTDVDLLLKMATVNGMKALGLDARDATFSPGARAGLIALRYNDGLPPRNGRDPLQTALATTTPLLIETWHGRCEAVSDIERATS